MIKGKLKEIEYTCSRCGFTDTIEWGCCGYKLRTLTVLFDCNDCGTAITLEVIFPKDKEKKLKFEIKFDDTNYIG